MSDSEKASVLEKIEALPAISNMASTVLELLSDPTTTASQIEQVASRDPSLTAGILKLANSAYFGMAGTIGSVRQAVVRLGWRRVYQLVVASSVHSVMDAPIPGYALQAGELWRHSMAVSVAAEDLAHTLKLNVPEETFTAALLHDIGKLAMCTVVDVDFAQIEHQVEAGSSFEVAEHDVIGIDHAEAGARILEHWSLPERIVRAVRWHHDPDQVAPPDLLLDVVHVADILCLMIGITVGSDGLQFKPCENTIERLGVKINHLEQVASRTLQATEELMESLDGAPAQPPESDGEPS